MEKGLVSIITPCYNSATYVYRLFDSILAQDYPDIEMFAIDDGSTDNTREIIESYITKFENRGYSLTYVHQENAGQAAAVNRGLKLVKGEFLTWPDSDDYYNRNDAISTFVREFNHLDNFYGVVCFIGTFVDENTLEIINRRIVFNKCEDLFENCLTGQNWLAVPINYMVKMQAFDKVNPERVIYCNRHVQNMQMLLPLFYSYKCKTINESLCNIVVRSSSYSNSRQPYEKVIDEIQGWLDIKLNTLDNIKELTFKDREKYKQICRKVNLMSKLDIAFIYKNKKDVYKYLHCLKDLGIRVCFKKRIKAFLLNSTFLYDYACRLCG